jgi:hypothetical protein
MRNTKTKIFLLLVFIVALLLILVVIKVFEKRIQKIENQEPGSITGKTEQPLENLINSKSFTSTKI